MRVVKAAQAGAALLANGDFEQNTAEKPLNWQAARNGCSLDAGQGRHGSRALGARNEVESAWTGASQTLQLNRSEAWPLVVRGWSKAVEVSGATDSGYSLYVDIIYSDGTPLWGQTANFPTGTHGWVKRELLLIPQKPIKTLTLHCIFRGHTGEAWFDDVTVEELKAEGDAVVFQGVPVATVGGVPRPRGKAVDFAASDGLKLRLRGSSAELLAPKGAAPGQSGFLVRDAAADSDFFGFEKGRCPELGLDLRISTAAVASGSTRTAGKAAPDHIEISGRISDHTGRDRAVTLVFALPIGAGDWRWGDDIHRERPSGGRGDFANLAMVPCGATGGMSLYPLAAISGEKLGLALGLDMSQPAVYRVGYHAGMRLLYIAYDFGLVPETRNFPGGADFRFVVFGFEPKWGFRAAYEKYTRIFEDHFRVRSPDQGIWMPFTDISTVQGWEDFGFRYKEGNSNVAWDDAHGILTFRYTEPMTWWMRMNKGLPRTPAEAMRAREALAETGNGHVREMAQVSRLAAMHDETGQPALMFRNEPWCDGAVWSLNPNPHLPTAANSGDLNAATVYWNDSIKANLYGAQAKGKLDGEYLDSLEGYVTADLNFRREHFAHTTVPLTFSTHDHRPALFKGLAVFEFTRWLSDDIRRLGKLMFANGVPYRFGFLCPYLDVLGTETDWVRDKKYTPASLTQMAYWRTLSGRKPYVLLMNTDYDTFTPDMLERYFQRCLLYGMFPSMFSHNAAENPYWQNPKWYNRDRLLFKKYQPVIKQLAEAGWQPVTLATSSNPKVLVERFGPDGLGTTYFTVLNDTAAAEEAAVRIDRGALAMSGEIEVMELLPTSVVPSPGDEWVVRLGAQEAKVYALRARK